MLSVDVLPVSSLPVVRARVEVVGAWSLTGRAEGSSWTVAESSGVSWLSDPWAPLNVPVEYTLTSSGESWTAGPVVRSYRGWHVLTDLQGRNVVDFLWEKGGGDPWERESRHEFFTVPGQALSPYMSAPVAGAGGGSLAARTVRESTAAMRRLVDRNVPVVLLYNPRRSRVGYDDVPLVRTVLLTGAPEDRTSRVEVAERSWALSYRLVPVPWGYVPPVATGADVRARFPTVGDLEASGLTAGDLAAGDWLVDW